MDIIGCKVDDVLIGIEAPTTKTRFDIAFEIYTYTHDIMNKPHSGMYSSPDAIFSQLMHLCLEPSIIGNNIDCYFCSLGCFPKYAVKLL